jgi:phthalate 4,5-cis-dihydrodiol dehydrogenase
MATTSKGKAAVRVGIVGLGGGASMMIPKFANTPGLEITAAADIDISMQERFKQDFPNAATYTAVEDLCASKNVDFVYIATPNMLHREHTMMALESGKHVLVEKPMTISLDDATAMIDAADRNGVLLGVNVANSFDPRVQKMREFTKAGELGELRMLHNWRYADWLYRP